MEMETVRLTETLICYNTTRRHNPVDWRWRQHGLLKRWYPTTTLHGVRTQKNEDGSITDPWNTGTYHNTTRCHNPEDWRWRHHGPLKHWYPTTTLHGVTTQKTSTWIFTTVKTSSLPSGKIYHNSQFLTGIRSVICYCMQSVISRQCISFWWCVA
jgi:hypothetical protein